MEGAVTTALVEGDVCAASRARDAAAVLLEAARAAGDRPQSRPPG